MLNCLASLAMSTRVLKALPGKLDIKRHSPYILDLSGLNLTSSHLLPSMKFHMIFQISIPFKRLITDDTYFQDFRAVF